MEVTSEFIALCVTDAAPVTVKKLAGIPSSVKFIAGVIVTVAVSTVPDGNGDVAGSQVTLAENWVFPDAPETGIAPRTGGVIPLITEDAIADFAVVIGEEEDEAKLEPAAFVATTVNVYDVLGANPLIEIGEEDPLPLAPPGEEITVYPVIAEPPVAPSVKATETVVPVAKSVAVPIVGA